MDLFTHIISVGKSHEEIALPFPPLLLKTIILSIIKASPVSLQVPVQTLNTETQKQTHWMSFDTAAQIALWTVKGICCLVSPQVGNKCACSVSQWRCFWALLDTAPTYAHKVALKCFNTIFVACCQSVSLTHILHNSVCSRFLSITLTFMTAQAFPLRHTVRLLKGHLETDLYLSVSGLAHICQQS